MHEDCDCLGHIFRVEEEGRHIGERYDTYDVEYEEQPSVIPFEVVGIDQTYDDCRGNHALEQIKYQVADPVSRKRHARYDLLVLQVLFSFIHNK